MKVAILGLGEAGRRYAQDFIDAGVRVAGFDLRPVAPVPGVEVTASVRDAITEADLVISVTTAAGSVEAASTAREHLRPDAVYADLNAASPDHKLLVAKTLGIGPFADVAVLAPVARQGVRTPVLVAGPGAARYVELMTRFGGEMEIVPGEPGAASSRKLLRSIFMKSLATTVLEALAAGRAAGCEEWVRGQMAGELGDTGDALLERLVTGTYQHSRRRLHEMTDTREYLKELGTPSDMVEGSITWLSAVDSGRRR